MTYDKLLEQWKQLDDIIKDAYKNIDTLKAQRHSVIAKCRRMLEKQVNKKE